MDVKEGRCGKGGEEIVEWFPALNLPKTKAKVQYNRSGGMVFTSERLGIQTKSWTSLCSSESNLSGGTEDRPVNGKSDDGAL